MFRKQLIANHRTVATSPFSTKQAFEPACSPRTLADSVRSVRSAGLYALGATSVCFLVGECGAGAICRLCHRCAHVARGRGSRLAPLGHEPCAPSIVGPCGRPLAVRRGPDEPVPVWQVVAADVRVRHGVCAAWRRARARRALWWRCRRRRRRADDARVCGARLCVLAVVYMNVSVRGKNSSAPGFRTLECLCVRHVFDTNTHLMTSTDRLTSTTTHTSQARCTAMST